MNASEAIDYIHSINWCFCKPGFDRIKILCDKLGNPQNSLKFIHVAGTNGKGSFCAMLDSVLRNAGYKVGLFTSPFIRKFNERICFDGKQISDSDLAEITSKIKPIAYAMEEKPTEFELITAIGFEYFKRCKCDIVILEVGMGGRLDSTNIIDSSILSVITGIALDHTAYLGDTVEKIAAEKAGIIKPHCPVLFGGNDPKAFCVIRSKANSSDAPFNFTQRDQIKNIRMFTEGTVFDFSQRKDIKIKLLGTYQPYNAANVICAVDILNTVGFKIDENSLYKGLEDTVWHARFELISKNPTVIYDGAHNPEGISEAVRSIKQYFPDKKVYILSGVMKDKDYSLIASDLSSVASKAFTVTPDNPRSLNAKEYAEVLNSKGIDSTPFDSIEKALKSAIFAAQNDDVPLICLGSLYLYSQLMDVLETL